MIFISYRVADSAHLVGRLRADLVRLYASARIVYRDKNDLQGGQDWPDELRRALIECPVLLAVIGPGWAEARFATGPQAGELRLSDAKDWVRTEIRTALELSKSDPGRHVIPIFVNATPMKEKEWLDRRGLADLFDKQGLPLREDPDYDHDLQQLLNRLETLRAELKASRKPDPPPRLPARPPVCVGRADLLAKLETLFLPSRVNAPLPRLAVAGIGGIGKSTTVLWFLYDPRVKKRYGVNRHFVSLDGADSRGAVIGKLAEALGIPTGPDTEGRVLASLDTGGRRLIVLDNAETPLESRERLTVEDLFGTLAGFPYVGLIATLRPTVPLTGWDTTDELTRLLAPADREAFDHHSGRKFAADPDAAGFVAALEGWPIVLRLAAEQAKLYRSIREFWTVWDRERDELLRQGADKASNFAVSVKLSLDSPHMTLAGRRLLALLARLPAGVRHDDLPEVLGHEGVKAAAALRKVGGLVIENEDRVRMLAPLREHLEVILPFDGDEREWTFRFYCGIATRRLNAPSSEWKAANARLAPETENVRVMIRCGLASHQRIPAYEAARGLGDFGRFVGLDFSEQLRSSALAAHEHNDHQAEADCILSLGNIALDRSDHAEAGRHYADALPLYRQVGDVLGEANCIKRLGDISLRRSDHAEAGRRYADALPLYRQVGDVLGEANCILSLGNIALDRGDHAEAGRRYAKALPLYRGIGSVLGEANCIRRLGDIARERSDHAEAGHHYDEALPLYRRVGQILGEANCIWSQGIIALQLSNHAEASRRNTDALPLYRRVGDVLGEANCIRSLGDIAHAEGKTETARLRWDESLILYQRIPEPCSIGETYERLARIATASPERQRFVAAARAAWTSIDRPDLIAQLDSEFPPDYAST